MTNPAQVDSEGAPEPREWTPVGEGERVLTLDALRGVAIFGVVIANVLTFAFPAWSPPSAADTDGGQGARLLVALLVEGKFYVLFALLFGIGLGLQSARSESSGRPFAGVFVRRLGVLLVLGLAHGVFLYSGDILAFYAVLGVIAMALRRLSLRTLLVVTAALFVASLVAIAVYSATHPGSVMPTVPDWQQLADQRRASLAAGDAPLAPEQDLRLAVLEVLADETRITQSGSWWDMTRHRAASYFLVGWPLRMAYTSWRVLALFVFGIYLIRRSVFLDSESCRPRYFTWLWSGLLIGLLLQVVAGAIQMLGARSFVLGTIAVAAVLVGGAIHSLGYAGGVAFLCQRPWGRRLLRPVAAVGRLALSNYLLSSIVFGLVFYGYGLGLFGRLSVAESVLVAVALYAAELVLSSLWLRRYRFGPFEWLWRSITYWRIQPLLR